MATLSATEQRRLGRVRPELMQLLLQFYDAANAAGYRLAIPELGGYRSTAQQSRIYADALAAGGGADTGYAAGRPGHSRHQYGAAFDVHIVAGGNEGDGTGTDADYAELARIGEELGLTAGYYFAERDVGKKDPYHFQLSEPFEDSVAKWNAMKTAGIVKSLAIIAIAAAIGRAWS